MPTIFAASVENAEIFFTLLVILISAKLMAEIFERLGQPAVVGEILAGVAVGPSLFALVEPSQILTVLAEMGVIFLLFNVGLEIKPQAILQVGKRAFMVGVLGGLIPFAGGYLTAFFWSGSNIESLFTGAAIAVTSTGITARILASMGLLNTKIARIILGAAVVDDILGLLILSVISSIGKGNTNFFTIIQTVSLAIGLWYSGRLSARV